MSAHRHLRRLAALSVFAALAACQAPGEEATNVGQACVESDLVEQCPPGSNPILGASAESMCEASASVDLTTQTGSVSGRCFGSGTCRVVCQFASPCACGVDEVTRDGVFCTDCSGAAACGNAVCEGGENPTTCPNDCMGDCSPGQERCQGTNRETCDGTGHWSLLACDVNTVCQASADQVTTSCVRNDVSTGGETGEPVNRQDRVDGRVWFGDGMLPPEGTGTMVVDPDVPSDGYVLEGLFFNVWNFNTRTSNKDLTRVGFISQAGGAGGEGIEVSHWQRYLVPADVEDGDHLVLWGPKGVARYDLQGNTPAEHLVEVAYPANMTGTPEMPLPGLTSYSAFSQDRRKVLWSRGFWNPNQMGFLRNAELFLFDADTGVNTRLGDTGFRTLAPSPLSLSPDGRTVIVPTTTVDYHSAALLVYRDAVPRRPLVLSRKGEAASSNPTLISIAPSGTLLATLGGAGGEPVGFPVSCSYGVDLWNMADGKRIYTLCGTNGATSIAGQLLFDPNGDRLSMVIGGVPFGVPNGAEPGVETWDLRQGKEISRITMTSAPKAEFLPNGKALALLNNDDTRAELTFWDTTTGVQTARVFSWDTRTPDALPGTESFEDPAGPGGVFKVGRVDGFRFSHRGTRLLVWGVTQGDAGSAEYVATFRIGGLQ
jgi:hypothetical protein